MLKEHKDWGKEYCFNYKKPEEIINALRKANDEGSFGFTLEYKPNFCRDCDESDIPTFPMAMRACFKPHPIEKRLEMYEEILTTG